MYYVMISCDYVCAMCPFMWGVRCCVVTLHIYIMGRKYNQIRFTEFYGESYLTSLLSIMRAAVPAPKTPTNLILNFAATNTLRNNTCIVRACGHSHGGNGREY